MEFLRQLQFLCVYCNVTNCVCGSRNRVVTGLGENQKRSLHHLKINSNIGRNNGFFERTLGFSTYAQEAMARANHFRNAGARRVADISSRLCSGAFYIYAVLGNNACTYLVYLPSITIVQHV